MRPLRRVVPSRLLVVREAARRRILAVVALALLCAGCDLAAVAATRDDRPLVLTTISVLADLTRQVAGEHVAVESLVDVGGDPHTYEPVPSDAGMVSDADLVVRNGLGLEPWLDVLLGANSQPPPVAAVAERIAAATDAGGHPDPHLWMDPHHVSRYVDRITAALVALDPAHATEYQSNADRYQRRLDGLDRRIRARLATVPDAQRRLVTSHDAFRYFGDRYDLEVVGTIWSVSTEREPSAEEIAGLVDAVRAAGVLTVFVETTINPDLMEQVARDAAVAVGQPLYGDSLGEPGSGADSYLGMMRANAERIAAGLGARSGS